MENIMSNFKKSFKSFAEAKDKGLADNDGLVPNQDIPKADKGPQLLNLAKSLAGRDYKGQMSTNPVKGTKENPLPYHGGDVKGDHKLLVHDDDDVQSGFAFKGNKVQTPENSASLGEKPSIKTQKVKSSKMTSEEFIKETKNLTPEGFINFFVEGSDEPLPTITDLYGNQFTPEPNQTIQYLAALMVKNPRLISRFVREIKRHENGMGTLMNEHFNHPEFYTAMADGMSKQDEGRKRCKRISRAMNDQYMEALNKYVMEQRVNEEIQPRVDLMPEDGGPVGNGPQNPAGRTPPRMANPQGGAMGGGGAGGTVPPGVNTGGAMGGGGVGGPTPPSPNGQPPGGAFGGGMGSPAPDGMQGAPPMMPPTGGPMGGGGPGLDMGTSQPGAPGAPMPKLKGETAHGNMIEEMGGYPHMFAHMSDYCVNGKCNK